MQALEEMDGAGPRHHAIVAMLYRRRREAKFERKGCKLETSKSCSQGPAAGLHLLYIYRGYR